MVLKFKIQLLKIALSKKAILLDLSDEDLTATAEILHHISLRETIHVLDLQGPVKGFEVAIKLFGMNPIFGLAKNNDKPLLSTLDGVGTLFIKNIHFLDLESQEYLAGFIILVCIAFLKVIRRLRAMFVLSVPVIRIYIILCKQVDFPKDYLLNSSIPPLLCHAC